MSAMRKLAIPAGIATAAIAPGASAAAAATAPHDAGVTMPRQATAQAPARRARAIEILNHDPLGHLPSGVHPRTTFTTNSNSKGSIFFYIQGSYSHVSYTSCDVYMYKTLPHAHLEIERPNGQAYTNTSTFDAVAGHGYDCTDGYPNINSGGYWHAILWSHTDGKYVNELSTRIYAVPR
jgi:hypothetical protein